MLKVKLENLFDKIACVLFYYQVKKEYRQVSLYSVFFENKYLTGKEL